MGEGDLMVASDYASFAPDYSFVSWRRVILGGSFVDLVQRQVLLDEVADALDTGDPLGVASANLDHIFHFGTNGSWRDQFAQRSLRWLTVLDGAPLAMRAAQITGQRWPRQAGSDLLVPILDLAQRLGGRVGFVGGATTMHRKLEERLARSHPSMAISGCWAPTRAQLQDPDAAKSLAAAVRVARTDIAVVGLGKPRQELWIERYFDVTAAKVLLAFGASADFLAGAADRAPKAFQASGTEWIYRLAREPRRMRKRYLSDGPRAMRNLLRDSYPVQAPLAYPTLSRRPSRRGLNGPPDEQIGQRLTNYPRFRA